MEHVIEGYGRSIIKHRWWVIVASLVFVAFCGLGAKNLWINADLRYYFGEDNPRLEHLENFEAAYSRIENIFIAIAPKNKDVFDRKTLAAIKDISEQSWKIPHSRRVDSITNFQHSRADEDDFIVEQIVDDPLTASRIGLAAIREKTLAEPMLLNRLISHKGDVTGINISLVRPKNSKTASTESTDHLFNMVEEFNEKYPDIDIYLSGWLMMEHAFGTAAQSDITIVIMFVLLFVLLLGVLKSLFSTLCIFFVILTAVITAMGLTGWLGIPISSPSSISPPVILTLAVAGSVHLFITLFNHMGKGMAQDDAIVQSLKENIWPIFLTSATTCIGFLTMNFADAPPFNDLGNMVAMGVAASFVLTIFTLPALISTRRLQISSDSGKSTNYYMDRLADLVISRRTTVVFVVIAISIATALGASRIKLDDNFVKYFDPSFEFRASSDFIEANLTGYHIAEYSLSAKVPEGINDPEYLARVEAFMAWSRIQNKVDHVTSYTDTLKKINQNLHQGNNEFYRLPDNRGLAAQYLLLYEMSLPFGYDLSNKINIDKSALRVSVTLNNVTSMEVAAFDQKAQQWLHHNAPEYMAAEGTGSAVMTSDLTIRNIKSMVVGTFSALLLISAILIFAFKSFKFGALSMIPNLLPIIVAFGIWGITVERLGLAASVFVALPIGIIVDDTIHFISKYLYAKRTLLLSPEASIRYAYNMVGRALWVSTVCIVGGFAALSFSAFKPVSDMGIMTSIVVTLALFLDLLLLPALILIADKPESSKEFSRANTSIQIANQVYRQGENT